MQAREYARLYLAEERLWWFRALHMFLLRLVPKQANRRDLLALDIGCGTGGFLKKLSSLGYQTIGLDYSDVALSYAARGQRIGLVRASANDLPFASVFDLVFSVDVLEVGSVDPERSVQSALKVIKPGGYGLFVMAAHQWLLSEHDRAVNSVRRYDLTQMKTIFSKSGVQILRATYLFFVLFPLIAARKMLNPKRSAVSGAEAVSDVSIPPALINGLLYQLCWLEGQLVSLVNLPIGSSVLVLLRKDSS